MSDVVDRFEGRFQSEARELLILPKAPVRGAGVLGDYLEPSVTFLASADGQTGQLDLRKGRLEWLVPNEKGRRGYGHDFEALTLYRIRACKCLAVELAPYMLPEMANCYRLLEVVEAGAAHPELEALARRYAEPVAISDPALGEFELNREFEWFEGRLDWLGEDCSVSLEVDGDGEDTAAGAFAALRELCAHKADWDKAFRTCAAGKLTDLANQWQQDEDKEAPPITEETFAARMTISEMTIGPEGAITVYFDDDDLFWGHAICVDATPADGPTDANIAG